MPNKKIFIIIFFFVSYMLSAQNASPQVASLIEKTAQKYNALSSFTLDFTVNIEGNKQKNLSFNGILLVKKEKYFITFDGQIVANDGKMMWNFQKATNEASLFDAEDDEFSIFHPSQMLNNWNKEYDAKFIREEESQKKQIAIVDLKPKKQSSFYKIRLFIDKSTSYIQQVMMYDLNETTLTYTITKFTPSTTIADSKFTFNRNDYPNVQVNDMR